MTVLRSREILPIPESKPPRNAVAAPETPPKTSESLNQSSKGMYTSIQTSSSLGKGIDVGVGSIVVSESGSVRRLSARLAKKVGERVEVGSGKRKKVEGTSSLPRVNTRHLGRQGSDMKLGVGSSDGNPDGAFVVSEVSQDVDDEDSVEVLKDSENMREGQDNGQCKRRCSIEVKALGFESSVEDKVEKGFLNLRSGKRVLKRDISNDIDIAGDPFQGIVHSKEGVAVLSGDLQVKSTSDAKIEEDENGLRKKRRYVRRKKGEDDKVSSETLVINGSALVNPGSDDRIRPSLGQTDHDAIKLAGSSGAEEVVKEDISISSNTNMCNRGRLSKEGKGKKKLAGSSGAEEVVKEDISIASNTNMCNRGRLSKEGKGKKKLVLGTTLSSGKMKLSAGASSSSGINTVNHEVVNMNGGNVSDVDLSASDEVLPDEVQIRGTNPSESGVRSNHRERFRDFARRNASRFAHFSSQDELGGRVHDVAGPNATPPESSNLVEDWPGPFSTAMKIIKDRESNRNGGRLGASTDKSEAVDLKWSPKSHKFCKLQKQVPSLQDICLSILSKNADAITSLDFVPDAMRHKICWSLCDSRRMDGHFLELLLHSTPTEIRLRDCSWLSEEQFVKVFEGCDTSKLMVLQLDQGGVCMPDYILSSTLARSPKNLPALTALSLKGAYRLSDAGLSMLTSAAPALKSIDISQCPLITSEGICSLASSLRFVLRELYIDNCHGTDAMVILPALQMLENLEVLSVAGILTVSDNFVDGLVSAHGSRIKELVLADCMELTDASLKTIGDNCFNLQAIDLTNLRKLTDISIGHLANGCQAIQMLKLSRNAFSDEAIAAYLDVNGASLKCLSLNNIIQVSTHTALSLSRNCKNLRSLDLSWCRSLTNEALGLIVDSCLFLRVLKLFGCTQVTNVFIEGHSNPNVKVIGLKMTSVFEHIEFPDFLLGPLRYPSASP